MEIALSDCASLVSLGRTTLDIQSILCTSVVLMLCMDFRPTMLWRQTNNHVGLDLVLLLFPSTRPSPTVFFLEGGRIRCRCDIDIDIAIYSSRRKIH